LIPDSWTLSLVSSNCAPVKVLPNVLVIAASGKIVPITGEHIPRRWQPE